MQSFFKKGGLFLQMSCKIFQNEHEKAIQMKKRCTFFYVMAYVIKSGKSESEKHCLNAFLWQKSHMWLFCHRKKATFGNVAFFLW